MDSAPSLFKTVVRGFVRPAGVCRKGSNKKNNEARASERSQNGIQETRNRGEEPC